MHPGCHPVQYKVVSCVSDLNAIMIHMFYNQYLSTKHIFKDIALYTPPVAHCLKDHLFYHEGNLLCLQPILNQLFHAHHQVALNLPRNVETWKEP